MAENMFHDVVDPSVTVGGKRKYSVVVSMVVHTIVIAASIIAPIVATSSDLIPVRTVLLAFAAPRPLPPAIPPPPSATRVLRAAPAPPPAFPIEAPDQITAEVPPPPIVEQLGTDMSGVVPGGAYSSGLLPSSPPAAIAPPSAPLRPGGDVKPPVKVKDVSPVYPRLAQASGVQGIVVIEATIGITGKVQNATVLRGVALLDAAALDAVRQWEYTPTLLNGSPVAIVMTVTVRFTLR